MAHVIDAIMGVAVAAVWLGLGVRFTGRMAENLGEDPRFWQLRLLPFGLFGPILLWFLFNRRGGGGWA